MCAAGPQRLTSVSGAASVGGWKARFRLGTVERRDGDSYGRSIQNKRKQGKDASNV
jgi:hypothetical protein